MEKIIVPTFIEYNACQFTTDNLENFLNFIDEYIYKTSVKITYRYYKDKNIPVKISFKWNPYEWDNPPTIELELNQYFMYEDGYPDNYKIINSEEISEDWYIHET